MHQKAFHCAASRDFEGFGYSFWLHTDETWDLAGGVARTVRFVTARHVAADTQLAVSSAKKGFARLCWTLCTSSRENMVGDLQKLPGSMACRCPGRRAKDRLTRWNADSSPRKCLTVGGSHSTILSTK
jgi:hypothetical protein